MRSGIAATRSSSKVHFQMGEGVNRSGNSRRVGKFPRTSVGVTRLVDPPEASKELPPVECR
jgi:hypothetical protein